MKNRKIPPKGAPSSFPSNLDPNSVAVIAWII